MYNWVTQRKIARTQEPNYPARAAQTVDLVVAKWIPTFAALLSCAVTPARPKLDVRQYEWQPSFAWVNAVVDTNVRTYIPATQAELQSYRVAQRPPLDVRRYEWAPESFDIVTRVDAQVKTWVPAFASTGGRTDDRAKLDVRRYDWDASESSWIQATQTQPPTVAQTAPAWTSQAQSFRTAATPPLDLFRAQSIPDIFGVPDDWITWVPIQDTGGRTRDRAKLDVRSYEWGQPAWITTSIPVVATTAQTWPAVLDKGQSYRTAARPSLDVRAYDWAPAFTWVQPVIDASIAKLAPIWSGELANFRTTDRPRLDVRAYAWAPDAAAWELINFAPPATQAQIWPAILQNLGTQYQTASRAKLDVRAYDWHPEFTWATKVVDATVAKWIPVFDAEVSYRTIAARQLDVRSITNAPEISWLAPTLPANTPLTTTIYLVGSYQAQISLTGSYQPMILLIGSVES
jgi:hypothetical protein